MRNNRDSYFLSVLCTLTALCACDFAFGQTKSITVPGRLRIIHDEPEPNGAPATFRNVCIKVECPTYSEYQDTSQKSFPLTGKEDVFIRDILVLKRDSTLTAEDVERFFNRVYSSAGYDGANVSSTPSMSKNCHGYATEDGRWLLEKGLNNVLNSKYTYKTLGEDLEGTIVLKVTGHTVKADTSQKEVNGEMEYRIVKTSEKYNASGIYMKDINIPDNGQLFEEDETVELEITGLIRTTDDNMHSTSTATGFYKKN